MNSISIHKDHLVVLKEYSDEQLGQLLRALMADVFEDEAILLPPDLLIIKKYIDNQNKRFSEQQSAKRRKIPNEPNPPNEPNEPTQPSVTVTKPVTNTRNQDKDAPPTPSRGKSAPFDKFWAAYPKKKSKGDAEKAWKALRPDSELLTKMLSALERATTCHDWMKEGGKFIPYPATWLRAKGWEDEYGDNKEGANGKRWDNLNTTRL